MISVFIARLGDILHILIRGCICRSSPSVACVLDDQIDLAPITLLFVGHPEFVIGTCGGVLVVLTEIFDVVLSDDQSEHV